jgi:hypothetical protein
MDCPPHRLTETPLRKMAFHHFLILIQVVMLLLGILQSKSLLSWKNISKQTARFQRKDYAWNRVNNVVNTYS